MRRNRLDEMRVSALMIGAAAALTACSPRDNAGGDTTAAAAAADTAAAAASATAGAAGDTTAAAAAGGALNDVTIAGTINTSNAAEIGSSELARNQASNAQVKQFARDMITEHRRMQGEADQVAKRNNLTPQPGAKADQMQQQTAATLDSLKGLRGAEFDRRYMAFQVQAHQTTLNDLQRFEGAAQNADLKALITKAIPSVRAHLERAQRIQGSLGSDTTAAAKKG